MTPVWEWESMGVSNKTFKHSHIANKSLSPKLLWMNNSKINEWFQSFLSERSQNTSIKDKSLIKLSITYGAPQ